MNRITQSGLTLAASFALAALFTPVAGAQAPQKPAYKRDVPAKLAKQAKVSEDSARGIAQAKVPGGTVQALELENEKGKLIYSFDFKVAGKDGIEEVTVNALDGSVVSVAHESAADEAKEKKAEAKEKKPGAMGMKKAGAKDTTRKP